MTDSLGGGAKELKGMLLQLYQLPSMKKRVLSRGRVQSALFFSLFSSVYVSFEILHVSYLQALNFGHVHSAIGIQFDS